MKKMKPKKKTNKPWSKSQEKFLFDGVSISGKKWFVRHCKKTESAVYSKLSRDYGKGGLTRGSYTLWELSRDTGYSRTQLRRAQSALGQKWKRLGPVGAHLITEEQKSELVVWLSHDYWSVTHRKYSCVWCASSNRRVEGRGLCVRCYAGHRRWCDLHGIYSTGEGQFQWAKKIAVELGEKTGKSSRMRELVDRLGSGVALTKTDLLWLISQRGQNGK